MGEHEDCPQHSDGPDYRAIRANRRHLALPPQKCTCAASQRPTLTETICEALESLDVLCAAEDTHGDTIRAHEVRGAVSDLRALLSDTTTTGGSDD